MGPLSSCPERQELANRTGRKPTDAIKALVSQIRKLRHRPLINTSVVPWVELALREMSLGRVKEIRGKDTAESPHQSRQLCPLWWQWPPKGHNQETFA